MAYQASLAAKYPWPQFELVVVGGPSFGMIEHYRQAVTELTGPGTGFAMTETLVAGVPMRVFESAPATMRDVWEMAIFHGDKPYVVYEDESYTYSEIAERVRALAWYLVDECGVASGDRVAVAMRNYPEWVISYWAGGVGRGGLGWHERLVDHAGDGVCSAGLGAQGADL